jgi:hypothetical protein
MPTADLCRCRPRRRLALAACAAALAFFLVAPPAGAVEWQPAEGGFGGRLVLPGGGVLHATDRPVYGLRTIELSEPGLALVLWEEESDLGERTPHYAVLADDGSRLRGRVRQTAYTVELVDHRFDPLTEGAPPLEPALSARPGDRLFLVQLFAAALPELQDEIAAAGGTIHRHLTRHTMIVELDAAARAAVAALPFVR